jgi:hypothetical protein
VLAGDDVRALLIFDITTDQISSAKIAPVDAPEVPSLSQAMSALLADGDDIRARALPAIAH